MRTGTRPQLDGGDLQCRRLGAFEPKIVAKRQRRLAGVDELVISLSVNGLTTGEVQAHLAEVYGARLCCNPALKRLRHDLRRPPHRRPQVDLSNFSRTDFLTVPGPEVAA